MMEHQIELGYIVLEVPDPGTLGPAFADVVGLVPGDPTSTGTLTWRNDRRANRLFVQAGPANDAIAIGIEALDGAAFDAAVAGLEGIGVDLAEGDGPERRVQKVVRARAPWGVDVELFLGLADGPVPFSSPPVPGGFLTEGVGFGHAVFVTTALDESHMFLTEGLGFAQSDWLETELAPGIALEVRFYHCNRRHHTIALARAPFELPQHLHHIMFELNERDDVGAAFDRAWATDLAIPNGLGRHDNDGMFSFYLQTPAGFQIEVGYGAREITEDWDDNRRYDQISAWGHQPLRSA
jgi:2,3-dihydroxybiphenyl 1,2-dioxygenase